MPNWVKNIVHITGPANDIAMALELMRDKKIDAAVVIDFNNVIPMPERLGITAGGYDRDYVALYLKTLNPSEIQVLQDKLHDRKLSFYGTYLKKYADSFTTARGFKDISTDRLERMKTTFEKEYNMISPASMEDVGKVYIDNILEYGHDAWYEWCVDNWGTKWNACACTIGDDYLEFETAWDAAEPIIIELSSRFPELTFSYEWADEDLGRNCGQMNIKTGSVISEKLFESFDEAHEFACMLWGYGPDDIEEEN